LQFIAHIKDIPSVEGRNSQLYLFKGMHREAEALLLQAGMVFKAIKLNINLSKWDR
jgi:intraflagellar transport protein 80